GLRADVEADEGLDDVDVADHRARVLGEARGDDVVLGEEDRDAHALGLHDRLEDEVDLVLLDERLADLVVLRLEEGVAHAAGDEDRVDLLEEVVDDLELVGDLGAAEDRDERLLGLDEDAAEGGELLLDEAAGGGGQEARDAADAGVVAVAGAEGVLDEDVAELRELAGEGGVG